MGKKGQLLVTEEQLQLASTMYKHTVSVKDADNAGIFMCGSGAGANMVANRYKGIRAICASELEEAFFARKDEDANVLTIGSRFVSFRKAIKIIQIFLTSEFEGGRHARRISKY